MSRPSVDESRGIQEARDAGGGRAGGGTGPSDHGLGSFELPWVQFPIWMVRCSYAARQERVTRTPSHHPRVRRRRHERGSPISAGRNRPMRPTIRASWAAVIALICAGLSTPANAAEKVTFVMSWAPDARWAGEFLAKERGYFAQEGLEVNFAHQRGSLASLHQVCAGAPRLAPP